MCFGGASRGGVADILRALLVDWCCIRKTQLQYLATDIADLGSCCCEWATFRWSLERWWNAGTRCWAVCCPRWTSAAYRSQTTSMASQCERPRGIILPLEWSFQFPRLWTDESVQENQVRPLSTSQMAMGPGRVRSLSRHNILLQNRKLPRYLGKKNPQSLVEIPHPGLYFRPTAPLARQSH
jgi:hypothetical protein